MLNRNNSDLVAKFLLQHRSPDVASSRELVESFHRLFSELEAHRDREEQLLSQLRDHLARFVPEAHAAPNGN